MGRTAKCRFCQNNIETKDAYKITKGSKVFYFCNESHYLKFFIKEEQEKKKKKRKPRKKTPNPDKDKAYYLICDIIGRKEIINTVLWAEWKEWNKVATNAIIGQYLEENRDYLCRKISRINDNEFLRIKYLSAILKNNLGDYKPNITEQVRETVILDNGFELFEPTVTKEKVQEAFILDDVEDDFL